MANTVTITRRWLAPFGVRCNTTGWLYADSFIDTDAGSGWTIGADLGPTAYADNGSGLVRVTMASTASLASGNRVYITGTTAAVYDGFWTVTVIDATNIDLQSSTYSVNPAAKGTLQEVSRYHFRVVGWRTPDELDIRNSYGILTDKSPISSSFIDMSGIYNLSPTEADNELYLSWVLPRGVRFHHISIYVQTTGTGSTWDVSLTSAKVMPTSANMTSLYGGALDGNIPGWATRTIISSPTAHTYLMQQPILSKNLTTNKFMINGYRAFFGDAAITLLDSGATDSGSHTAIGNSYDLSGSDGEQTEVTVTNLVDSTLGTVQYSAGPWYGSGVTQGSTTLATFIDVEDTELSPRQLVELDYEGLSIEVDNLNDSPIDGMALTIATTMISGPDDLYRLHWAMQNRVPILIVTTNDDGSIVYAKTWSGRIVSVPKTGGIRKNSSGPNVIQFVIDKQYNYFRDLLWYGIVSATTSGRTLTFNGDLRRRLPAGTPFRIRNSTGNDGWYAVESISYSYSADLTSVVTVENLADGTDDGYIEVYDW